MVIDPESGTIPFPFGTCALSAQGDALSLTVSAPTPEELARMQEVIASHLLRFAFREDLTVDWQG